MVASGNEHHSSPLSQTSILSIEITDKRLVIQAISLKQWVVRGNGYACIPSILLGSYIRREAEERDVCAHGTPHAYIFFKIFLGKKHYQSIGKSGPSDSAWLLLLSALAAIQDRVSQVDIER